MNKTIILLLFFLTLFSCQQNPTQEATVAENTAAANQPEPTATPILEVNLEDAAQDGEFPTSKIVNLSFDPVFKKANKYEAVPLKPFLEKLITTQHLDPTNTEVIFLCKDGYNPSMSLEKVINSSPYLAIKDIDAPAGKQWADTLKGLWSPYYLIWENVSKEEKGYTWPYGLKYLQFKAAAEAYKAAMPSDEAQLAGFELYKAKCMKCHSVNKVGGIMGPEMNIPKNITEYWQKEDIIAFVKNPYSYRYNSRMPPVADIKDIELEQIIRYLEYMKGQKISLD
jgi:mono/diheme cytochrome c family protein